MIGALIRYEYSYKSEMFQDYGFHTENPIVLEFYSLSKSLSLQMILEKYQTFFDCSGLRLRC